MSDVIPSGLLAGGAALWQALLAQDVALSDVLNPTRDVALEACRCKDRCDRLSEEVAAAPVLIDNGKGQPVAHPAWVEARQQANVLKQLVVALRLPDAATGKRPQARPGAASRAPGNVSSLDRARARAAASSA